MTIGTNPLGAVALSESLQYQAFDLMGGTTHTVTLGAATDAKLSSFSALPFDATLDFSCDGLLYDGFGMLKDAKKPSTWTPDVGVTTTWVPDPKV